MNKEIPCFTYQVGKHLKATFKPVLLMVGKWAVSNTGVCQPAIILEDHLT